MKLLFTNHAPEDSRAPFTAEVTKELARRGHRVAFFSSAPFLSPHPPTCPFVPDLIHGQHPHETMAALRAWPGTPALYFLLGDTPPETPPPVHPRLLAYATSSATLLPWLAHYSGHPPYLLRLIPYGPFARPSQPPSPQPRACSLSHTVDHLEAAYGHVLAQPLPRQTTPHLLASTTPAPAPARTSPPQPKPPAAPQLLWRNLSRCPASGSSPAPPDSLCGIPL